MDPITTLRLDEGTLDSAEAHESYDGLHYSSSDISGRSLAGASFSECRFDDLVAHSTDLRSASLTDTTMVKLDASVLSAPRSSFRNVNILDSRLGSAEFYESGWHSVRVQNCKLGYLNLRGAQLKDVLFENCSVEEIDLAGADVNRLAFINSRIDVIDLTRSTLVDVDLRRAELRAITSLRGLRGATISSVQVADLAAVMADDLGILVEE